MSPLGRMTSHVGAEELQNSALDNYYKVDRDLGIFEDWSHNIKFMRPSFSSPLAQSLWRRTTKGCRANFSQLKQIKSNKYC